MYAQAEADKRICRQASKAITRTLDEVLEGTNNPAASSSTPVGWQTPVSNFDHRVREQGGLQPLEGDASGLPDFDILNDSLEAFDFATWFKNVDWTGTTLEWSTF